MVPFVSTSGTLAGLHKAAKRRMRAAYRPGTRANQRCQIRSYLEFCIAHDLEYKSPTPHTLCLYAEFLAQKLTSPKSVRNYLRAISTYHNYLGLQAPALSNFHYQLMLRALPLTMRHFLSQKLPNTPDILFNICLVCDNLGSIGIVLKVAFTLGFFGFLRQSNLAPSSPQRFDASRHTTRSDIMIQTSGLLVRLKWSKTHQAPSIPATIPIPTMPGHCTDPLAAYHHRLRAVPTRHPNDPLLSLPNGRLITCRYLQRALQLSHCMAFAGVPPRPPFRPAPTSWPLNSMASGGATLSLTICSGINDSPLPCPRPWSGPWIYICNFWGCHPEDSGLTLMNTTLYNELFSKPHFLWHLGSQLNWTRHLLVFNISRHAYRRVL